MPLRAAGPLAWRRSLNAKLFLALALLTALLAVSVAALIIQGFKGSIESYTKALAQSAAWGAAGDISRLDPDLKDRRKAAEILATWVNPDSVNRLDIFMAARSEGEDYVELWATSDDRPEETFFDPEAIAEIIGSAQETAEPANLGAGRAAWCVYVPLQGRGDTPRAALRAFGTLARWDAVWKDTYTLTLKVIPVVLVLEFSLLWLFTTAFVRRPVNKILLAMKSLGAGDASARAGLASHDELGQIAGRFNEMADDLQAAGLERESLLREIRGFNATLQERVDGALFELRGKNDELEALMGRIALLHDELGRQERLAVAGQLAAAFAHEVGTPLNLVDSHIQLLMADPGTDGETRARLGTVRSQIERAGGIVKKLLGHTRPMEPQPEPLSPDELLGGLQQLLAPALAARRVGLTVRAPGGRGLCADRKQLEQVLINLVNNAMDAMPCGGHITIALSQRAGGQWEFAVSDTGTGVPDENLGRVFKPLFTTKPDGKGTGLGLAICREIVRAHGGEIGIKNNPGGGATVRFTLGNMDKPPVASG